MKVVTETPDRFLSGTGRQLKSLGPLVVKLLSMRFAVFATVALEGMTMHFRPCLLVSVEIKLQLLGTSPSNVSMYVLQGIVPSFFRVSKVRGIGVSPNNLGYSYHLPLL